MREKLPMILGTIGVLIALHGVNSQSVPNVLYGWMLLWFARTDSSDEEKK